MVMSNHHRIIAIKLFFTLLLACAGTNCMAIDIHPALLIKPNTKYYIYNNHYNRFLCTRNDREGFAGLSQWGINDSIDYIFTVLPSTSDDYYWLRQESTGKYLQASNASNDTWNVWLTSNLNDSYDSFKWKLTAGKAGTLSNKRSSGKFLGVDSGQESQLYIGVYYDKNSGELSEWQFIPVETDDANSILNEYGKYEYYTDSIRSAELILDSAIDYHVTNVTPMGDCKIQLNHDDAWLIFENCRPSVVTSKWLKQISIKGEKAEKGKNCRVTIWLDGAVVIPQNQTNYVPFIGYSESNREGDTYPFFTGANALDDKTNANNRIRSFILKRGYMATVATAKDGTSYSRVYVADHQDLIVDLLPTALDRRISYINIKKWNYVSKKGWSSTEGLSAINTEGGLVKSTWFYTWSADKSNQPDMEYVPMNTHQYWPSVSSIAALTDCTHMLSINEPDHSEQHTNCSCNENKHGTTSAWTATTWTPRYQTTGMRIGSPCPTDASWVKDYIKHVDEMAYRCDFVAFHAYWGSNEAPSIDSWYNQLKAIYDATGRPIWLTEFNNGASWTKETKPSYSANGEKMKEIIQMLEDAPFIERYCIYNWDDWHLAVLTWDNDKKSWWVNPAGQAYRDVKPHFAYNAKMQKVPNWWGFDLKKNSDELALEKLQWHNNKTGTLSIKNANIDQTAELTLECQKEDGSWTLFRTIDERELFDNSSYNIILAGDEETLNSFYQENKESLVLRLYIKDIKGKEARSAATSFDWPKWMAEDNGIEHLTDKQSVTGYFDTTGRPLDSQQKGLTIIRQHGKTRKVLNK